MSVQCIPYETPLALRLYRKKIGVCRGIPIFLLFALKVKVSNDQVMVQSERNSPPKTEVGKN